MIHPTAIVDKRAELSENVDIGPYAIIGKNVIIAKNCQIASHAVIEGKTYIGENSKIFSHAVIGTPPQDIKYKGEPTKLEIGNNCVFREFTSINRGTSHGGGTTKIGNDCLFMANSHVAHDCHLGNGVVLANSVALAGHVQVGNCVWFGGLAGIHQFVKIGDYAFIAAGSMVRKDIPPYMLAQGDRAKLIRVNEIGLQRHGFSENQITAIKQFYKQLKDNNLQIAYRDFKLHTQTGNEIELILKFLQQTDNITSFR